MQHSKGVGAQEILGLIFLPPIPHLQILTLISGWLEQGEKPSGPLPLGSMSWSTWTLIIPLSGPAPIPFGCATVSRCSYLFE